MSVNIHRINSSCHNRRISVDLLSIFFGIGAWIGVNGIYNQLPLLVQTAPEGWNLPSYISIIVQIANIGPISYSLLKKCFPESVKESKCIYIVLMIGMLSMLLMAFLYQKTIYISRAEHSMALLSLTFFSALVGCTSSVLFMPFMGNFIKIYLITYLIGEGLSGFLPSILTLIQGVGGNSVCEDILDPITNMSHLVPISNSPRFSSGIYFLLIFVILTLSTISFFLLNVLNVCKSVRINHKLPKKSQSDFREGDENLSNYNISNNNICEERVSQSTYISLLILMCTVCCFGNGVLPSIQSFSCLPYGNVAYHLTVALSNMANPAMCFLALFLPCISITSVLYLTSTFIIIGTCLITIASLSPNPPFADTMEGQIFIVMAWVIEVGLLSYIKLMITSIFYKQGGKSLFWCGAFTQMGSTVGALTFFFIINFTNTFKSFDPCK